MPNETRDTKARMDPTQPMPPEAQEFARKVNKMLNGQPKDEATVARQLDGMEDMFDLIAAGLYSLASMLVGEGEDSIRLVETAVANAEVSACTEPEQARRSSRRALVTAALELIARRDTASLAASEGLERADTCIEDDDLDAAGMSREELERMMAGPDRDRVRNWLESLPTAMRTIFVLRAVAGYSTPETAKLLDRDQGTKGPRDRGWSAEAVRELYRQGLCSLASQMIKAGSRE
ncbi:MAG TPA: sigma factor-like helix-turn-helix DNA-binding protein [Terracidiphilus sp.]|jgi:DNA-directed RNA polymerase specialized sigma24 family protein|nr:sigma factor-like helix-turn-helix DNA-binding protein [Terracidiphilus sp.]